jgi:hypothetical protein
MPLDAHYKLPPLRLLSLPLRKSRRHALKDGFVEAVQIYGPDVRQMRTTSVEIERRKIVDNAAGKVYPRSMRCQEEIC